MKKLMLLSAIFLVSLGAVVSVTGVFLKPVHGQGTLSNADIVGSYAFNLVGSGGDQVQFSVPGTLSQSVPLNVVPNGTFGAICDSPTNPCFQVDFANPAPQLNLPIATPLSLAGHFVADGAGNITSGSGFVFSQSLHTTDGANYTVFDRSCNFTLTGTYSITGGTSTLTVNPVGPCITPGLSATFNLLPGNAERKDGVEFGVIYLSSPIANSGTFSSFLNGSFFKQ
jgi:hypothetical protein